MAIAIALGCGAVTAELASELSSQTVLVRHRMQSIRARISQLRTEAAAAQQQLANERTVGENLNRVLSAGDVILLPLIPQNGSSAHGTVAISRRAGGSIVEIAGLHTIHGQSCIMWWLPAHGAVSEAAVLRPDAEGRASLSVRMPPQGVRITGAIVTMEPGQSSGQGTGKTLLKGALTGPRILS